MTVVFITGLFTAIVFMRIDDPTNSTDHNNERQTHESIIDSMSTTNQLISQNTEALEDENIALNTRISELENIIESYKSETSSDEDPEENEDSEKKSRFDPDNYVLTIEQLVEAGIDTGVASDIVSRRQELELKKLELRDRAAREGYLGTSSYIQELRKLQNEETSLREEIGDNSYDKYLYATGQNNRVQILSVMANSAAEQIGLKNGDIILNYGDQKLFEWSELQRATANGVRNEYVSIDVMRDGTMMNLWIPRGPLGVRLDMVRVKP